jgi:hypothetical protein
MRMGAFLRDGRSLHQSAVDVPIDLAVRVNNLVGIILRDDRNGFLFAPCGLEAKPRIGLCCMVYGVLPESLAIVRAGSLATACVESLAIASAGSLVTGGFNFLEITGVRFFATAFIGLSGVLDADFCVIT